MKGRPVELAICAILRRCNLKLMFSRDTFIGCLLCDVLMVRAITGEVASYLGAFQLKLSIKELAFHDPSRCVKHCGCRGEDRPELYFMMCMLLGSVTSSLCVSCIPLSSPPGVMSNMH